MKRDYLKFILALLPVILTLIGGVTWLTYLRSDVNHLLTSVEEIHASSKEQDKKLGGLSTDMALVKQALGIKAAGETASARSPLFLAK